MQDFDKYSNNYMEVLNIKKSNQKNKKYSADVRIGDKIYKNINFGDTRYQQYHDNTKLKLYKHLDHNDTDRRTLYHIRHKNNNGLASLLSKHYLW